jgi:hypothetical protein
MAKLYLFLRVGEEDIPHYVALRSKSGVGAMAETEICLAVKVSVLEPQTFLGALDNASPIPHVSAWVEEMGRQMLHLRSH